MDIYILEGARTPFGSFGGSLKGVSATELGVTSCRESIQRSGIDVDDIDLTVVGNVIHSSKNAAYISRHIALQSGVSISSPSLTVNRLCGSGLQAVISVAQSLILGEGELGLACGTENMSQSPFVIQGPRFGTGLKSPQIEDMLWASLTDEYSGIGMGMTAENLARKYNISRDEQDAYALLSQKRATNAKKSGLFAAEIVPVEIKKREGIEKIDTDEHIRESTNIEALCSLKPAFDKKDGTVTSGNASGINDGAASLIISNESYASKNNKQPLARIVSWGIAGVDPTIMGIGPVPAIQKTLEKANLSLDDIDLIEINEAFASQYLSVEKVLGLNRDITNVNGGAIALGHPIGASGARILYSMVCELKRRKGRYGIVSLCIGGGQGIAMLVEAC